MWRPRSLLLVALLTITAVIAGCASGALPGRSRSSASAGNGVALAQGSPATAPGEPIAITAFDLGFGPATVTVPNPGSYQFVLVNTGVVLHDLTFADGTTTTAEAGTTSDPATVTVPAGGLDFWCSIPGHREAGMHGRIEVAGAPAPSAAPTMAPDDHGGPPGSVPGVDPDPNAPEPVLYDATAPARLDGDVHDIELVIEEKLMTVAAGYQVAAWTFGGTVPGPVIRVKVGDTIRVHLVNPPNAQLSHSVDFHASQVAWNDEMTSIGPGEEKLYEWHADYAGVWMYHCGTTPALHHIANGMYGMVIVEPPEGLAPVDHEFALVQSEWYIDGQGAPASLTKAGAAAPEPDFVVFNGVANQYKDHPLEVETGARVRFFVLDAGPSIDSSFHIVGTIFDQVIKEGVALLRGNEGSWGAQAVDLSPAQGAIIETTTAEDGLYPIVTHAFNLVGRGALGLLQAGDGDPLN
jgi:nitrite reductase (NO-forming)